MGTLLVLLFLFSFGAGEELRIGMNGDFFPQKDSVYICGATPLDQHPYYYITSFVPHIKLGKIHHFGIFACKDPGSTAKYWNSMDNFLGVQQDGLPLATTCKNIFNVNIMYAWSYNTSSMVMPNDSAFEVGWDTDLRYLVFEIHYPHVSAYKDGVGDDSHVIVNYQLKKPRYAAGYLASAPIDIYTPDFPARQNYTIDMVMNVTTQIHPFLYQVHTHLIGTKVSGYNIKYDENNLNDMKWTQIGMRDPMTPQLWVPVDNNVTMEPGDIFAVRCHYYNYRDVPTKLGNSEEQEMCNFYIIYWSEWDKILHRSFLTKEVQMPFEKFGLKNIPKDA